MSPNEILKKENESLKAELTEVKADLDLADELHYDEIANLKSYCWTFMAVAYIELMYIIFG